MISEKTRNWINSCHDLERFEVVIPPGIQIGCLVYKDQYGRTLTDEGIGPVIHSVLYTDIDDDEIGQMVTYKNHIKKLQLDGLNVNEESYRNKRPIA